MTDLPNEIMVWHSMEKLTHIGTWATERYPEEAVAYIPRADAEAAMAAVVERCEEAADRHSAQGHVGSPGQWLRALAPASGLAMLAELQARVEKAESHAKSTNSVWQRNLELIAERDRLAAANAVLEAKVAGLRRDALILLAQIDGVEDATGEAPEGEDALLVAEIRAALATQEAGNAQSTPPISPEEAQFNAVRYHERFGPLDEKGNPVDPRRRG